MKLTESEKRAKSAAYYIANKDKVLAQQALYRAANTEKRKATKAAWRGKNPERARAGEAAWRALNHEKERARKAAWQKDNRGKYSAHQAKRRASKLKATPAWADLDAIKDVYLEAQYQRLTVDHIVPLRSKLVCGLHVLDNLQLLTMSENSRKRNRHWPDMPH